MSQPCDLIDFRQAMRMLAGGVSVITVGTGEDRTGFTPALDDLHQQIRLGMADFVRIP